MAWQGEVERLLRAAVAEGAVPGVAALVTDAEQTLHAAGFGTLAPDSPCALFSMTKALTSATALGLVEEGLLDLDAPLGGLVPPLAAVPVLDGFDQEGRPRLRPAARPITLRALLTHTAGFGYVFWSPALSRFETVAAPLGYGPTQGLSPPLLFDPGSDWTYGIGHDWAGLVVEAAAGERLGAVMRRRLLDPLGMDSTDLRPSPALLARRAPLHERTADGLRPRPPQPPLAGAERDGGGGGLVGTAEDYARFLRLILNGGVAPGAGRLLRAETVALMTRDALGPLRVRPLSTTRPELTADLDLLPGVPCGFTLAFLINREPVPGGRSAGSLGWAGLANTYYWIDLRRGRAALLMTQILPFLDPPVVRLLGRFEQLVSAAVR